MKKIAIFGKPANGKSTLSQQLALATGIKRYALDSLLYKATGEEVEREDYETTHNNILATDAWIIEGFAPLTNVASFYERLEAADTLIYIDLPYWVTYYLVIKRFFKGLFIKPEGWPEGSSILKGTLESFRVLRLCPKFWNDQFLKKLEETYSGKTLHVVKSLKELNHFVKNTIL